MKEGNTVGSKTWGGINFYMSTIKNKTQQRNDGRKKMLDSSLQEKYAVPQDNLQVKVSVNTENWKMIGSGSIYRTKK